MDFRVDAAERRVCLAATLARHTDWATATVRTGWGLLADRGCVSRSRWPDSWRGCGPGTCSGSSAPAGSGR